MLILLFYFNNISLRLSEKKIVKGTPRNRTSTLPHRQHNHNLQAIASCWLLGGKLLGSMSHLILCCRSTFARSVNPTLFSALQRTSAFFRALQRSSAFFSVLQRSSALFSALQRSSALFSVNHRCLKIGLNN